MANSVWINEGALVVDENGVVLCDECPCGNPCEGCDGPGPIQWQVVIAGFTNNTCSDCNDFNGTFILNFVSEADQGTPCTLVDCVWEYEIPGGLCGNPGFPVTALVLHIFSNPPGDVRFITVGHRGICQLDTRWQKDYAPDKPVCLDLVDESIPLDLPQAGWCAGGPTCVITAL